MMKFFKYTAFLFLLLILPFAGYSQSKVPGIIPIPQHWQWKKGSTDFSTIKTIVLGTNSDKQDRFTAEKIQQNLSDLFNIKVNIKSEDNVSSIQHAIIIGNPSKSELTRHLVKPNELTQKMKKAGYVLKLSGSSAVIAGESATGRFYGAMSLNQLLRSSDTPTLRDISISDYPTMKFRGVSDDMSRGQVSTEKNIKKIIRFMARYKMNA
ncbi:MAG TPA: glycoside hydrolase family 20 zincin-like fold domain-containing protein, partial [Balneolaceae bacterium]|nr:glycoside hydrolase family 20 zincin-like fold domain-containing protein [Balneolaceae bacterium]